MWSYEHAVAVEERLRIVHRTAIGDPTADEVGPEIGLGTTGDLPATIAALIARAPGA